MTYREPHKEDPLKFVVDEEAIQQEAVKRRAAKCAEQRSTWPEELSFYGISSWERTRDELFVLVFGGLMLSIASIILSRGGIGIFILVTMIILFLLIHPLGWISEESLVAKYIAGAIQWTGEHFCFSTLCLFAIIFIYLLIREKPLVRKTITLLRYAGAARRLVSDGGVTARSTVRSWEWMVYREGVRTLLETLLQRSGMPPFKLSRELYYEPSDCFRLYLEQYENTPAEQCVDEERVCQHLEVLGTALIDLDRRRYGAHEDQKRNADAERDHQRLNTYDRALIRQAYEKLLMLLTAPPATAPDVQVRVAHEAPIITEEQALHLPVSENRAVAGNDT